MSIVSPFPRIRASVLENEHRADLVAFLEKDSPDTLYLRSLIHEYGVTRTPAAEHGRFFGGWQDDRLVSVAFAGNSRNLTTWGPEESVGPALDLAVAEPRRPRLFVGPGDHARMARRAFSRISASPVLDRDQIYYLLAPDTLTPLEPLPLTPATLGDVEETTRAQAAMTEEDLGVPADQIDFNRLRDLTRKRITRGKVWVFRQESHLVFKTEESARAPDGILVGGVFTDPAHRSHGYCARGMATWGRLLFEQGLRSIALHVDASNHPAIKAYERAGFRKHSLLRLILTY